MRRHDAGPPKPAPGGFYAVGGGTKACSNARDATFLLVGLGGLGSPLALALAAAGAGRLVLVDDDLVDLSNLPRQVLYRTEDIGRPKALAARDALMRRGYDRAEPVKARFDDRTACGLVASADVVLDGSDNLATKFLVNDACIMASRPFVIGGALGQKGQVFPVRPERDACYRCLFEAVPEVEGPTCREAGVLGPTCGEVAARQVKSAIALFGDSSALLGKIWVFDVDSWRSLSVYPRPDCLCQELGSKHGFQGGDSHASSSSSYAPAQADQWQGGGHRRRRDRG